MEVYLCAAKLCPGNIFPTPYPQGYGATPPLPSLRTAPSVMGGACRTPPLMAMPVASYIQLTAARAASARGSGLRPRRPTQDGRIRHPPPGASPSHPAIRSSRTVHHRTPDARERPERRTEASGTMGRTPVVCLECAHATIDFKPTSATPRSLGVMAAQPACQQAGIDRAVRFDPMGTGHDRHAHFPAGLAGETLRDRTLRAKLPCRHSAGGGTCHVGVTERSRFDHEGRGPGTRARPRGNVQERQARRDQEDANTEGGLAS